MGGKGPVSGSMRSARAEAERYLHEEHDIKREARRLRETLSRSLSACASLFRMMDVDNNGQITRGEFGEALEALGAHASERAVDDLFGEFDTDRSGEISYGEFVLYAVRDKLRHSATTVMRCFRSFDTDGNGVVDKFEFRRAINSLGWEVFDRFTFQFQ